MTFSRLTAERGRRPSPAPTSRWSTRSRTLATAGLLSAKARPLTGSVAAVSVGVVEGEPVLDLDYPEDSTADTDMNVVMTGDGRFVEVQGTAEADPFDRELLGRLLDLATKGCADLTALQQSALDAPARSRT